MELLNALESGLMQGVIFYPLVLSLALSYRLLKFPDITIEGTFALSGAAFGVILTSTHSYSLAISGACLFAVMAGAITAYLHHYLHINKFLAGIIVVTALYSVIVRLMNGGNISILAFNLSSSYLSLLFVSASIVLSALAYFFYRSSVGIKVRGAAINPDLSRRLGQPTGAYFVLGLALNNGLAAFTGIFFSLDAGFADLKIGQGSLIIGLAALAIGERLVPRSRLSIPLYVLLSAAVGSVFYELLWAGALLLDIRPSDLKILSAIIVVILFMLKKRTTSDDDL